MRLGFCLISLVMVSFLSCRDKGFDKDAAGIFEATEVLVSSEAQGKIMELNLEEGDLLDAGNVYGYVDSTQLYLKKRQLIAGMRSVDIRRQTDSGNRATNSDSSYRTTSYGEFGKSECR